MARVVALVLAAGLGTRLRPLTEHVPKALVPIGDRPALTHAVAAARAAGASPIAVNAFHLADAVAAYAAAQGLALSRETELLGTAGGLAAARAVLGAVGAPVLVVNADVFFPEGVELGALVRAHEAARPDATLLVRRPARPLGNVGVDAGGRVVRLRGDAPALSEARSYDFLGVHVVGPALALPERGCLVGDVYIPAIARGARLEVVVHAGPAIDTGTLADYHAANLAWLDARGDRSFVAEGAEVTAEATRSVVGRGARVSAPIERVVVWPGAAVDRPTEGAVVTPFGDLPVGPRPE